MDNYIGKHLLVDCYNCKDDALSSASKILLAATDAAKRIGMDISDTFVNENDEEIIAAAYGVKAHICIHAYPEMSFVAVDIYNFDTDLNPARTMAMIRASFRPERIRATSVKRGNINPDMKPTINSKSTTMHKFKNTGQQVSAAGKKVAKYLSHKRVVNYINRKNGGPDGMGPE